MPDTFHSLNIGDIRAAERINYPEITSPAIDILSAARMNLNLPKYNLGATAAFFNLKNTKRHRALEDATAAYEIFFKLKDILREKGIITLEDYMSRYGINNERKNKII